MTQNEHTLSYLDDQERLFIFNKLVEGCNHLYSKGKIQKDKLKPILDEFVRLTDNDPEFLVRFTSYAISKIDSKDLKVLAIFANSLSDADGTPFSEGSKYRKPNYRLVSQAALQRLDPKLVSRVIEIANLKQAFHNKKEGTHFSRSLKTAVKKYLKYREQNSKALEGIRKVGFSETVKGMYRSIHLAPSDNAAAILKWKQKDGRVIELKRDVFNFKGMTDLQIAEKIRAEKLPPTGVLGALPDKVSPVIAVAILEQATGDQAVILREMFDSQGLLKNKEVMAVFTEKIKTAKTALDRVDRINTEVDKEVDQALKEARAERRKEVVGDIGKLFLHIDMSASMKEAIEFAKERGAIIAECVQNPKDNFLWGLFNSQGYVLDKPETFEKDAFKSYLYSVKAGGGTNCFACWKYAREQGCEIDVFITDQDPDNPTATKVQLLKRLVDMGVSYPKAVVIVDMSRGRCSSLYDALIQVGIPTTVIQPDTLTESALVAQSVRMALKGATAVIDEIMATPLLTLPEWWYVVK